ncbi:MAG: hypothetical protein WBC18_07295 [Ottowia sp.]|uniref:hypothetical protein n=1 Tax=unclassified Ottowia TaxID=2645081 RepID=UPI003C2DD15A
MKNSPHASRLSLAAIVVTALFLGACGEKPQTIGTRSSDKEPWTGSVQKAFDAPGWKPGDKASWEEQIKQRNRGQNEFVRMGQ